MKALLCVNCWDFFSVTKKLRVCECGQSKVRYANRHEEDTVAVYEGTYAIPVGINNRSLGGAVRRQGRRKQDFTAYVIPEENRLYVQVGNLTEDSWEGDVPVLDEEKAV